MHEDVATLSRINEEITTAEDQGDAETLERLLAPMLAFRRANGAIVGKAEVLKAAARSGPRELTIRSVVLLGSHRALVTALVAMPVGGKLQQFDNARLFIRTEAGWKLLAWANEPV